jgi:hypothetical protein
MMLKKTVKDEAEKNWNLLTNSVAKGQITSVRDGKRGHTRERGLDARNWKGPINIRKNCHGGKETELCR